MYLFFDTETTGLPKNYKAPASDIDNWPRMIQIGWILSNDKGERIDSAEFIIKPDGFSIPSSASNIHGITTQRAVKEGVPLDDVLNKFNEIVDDASVIIAHNISFDEKIIGAEFIRRNIASSFDAKPKYCTMLNSTDFCKIPGYYGFKWPKLSELHIKLFGEDFEGAHNAFADIEATERCYFEMKKRGII
ncbi:MAG: 3'-5' exonuclease [Bacteroidetes bacterium]|nr:MAG: 3'-5' exonuclease [Bacteroidota bacterium]